MTKQWMSLGLRSRGSRRLVNVFVKTSTPPKTFNVALRRRARGNDIVVAQRLKRRKTIFDKLRREPNMQLSTMQDVAGARVIFKNIDDLMAFRAALHSAKVDHV